MLNFGANPKTAAVFPTAVKMPDVDFIATVLRNERASDTNANANATGRGRSVNLAAAAEDAESESSPLGLDESALDRFAHAGERLKPWEERVSVVAWRGADVPFAPSMPFGADRMDSALCREMLVDVLDLAPEEADRALAPERRRRVLRRRGRAAAPRHRRGARGVDGIATRASHEPRDDSEVARGDALRRRQRKSRRRQGERLGRLGRLGRLRFGVVVFEGARRRMARRAIHRHRLGPLRRRAPSRPPRRSAHARATPTLQVRARHRRRRGGSGLAALEAMAAASLVFRVESPLADFYAADLQPWTHYVPVAADLSDLEEKYLWAQSHQTEARDIAARAPFSRGT